MAQLLAGWMASGWLAGELAGWLGEHQIQRPGLKGGKMVVQWPYSNIETSALSFETVRLEAVSLEAVRLGKAIRLSSLQTVNLDAINIETTNKIPRSLVAHKGAGGYNHGNKL